ncbi:MAG: DUF3429 domain-containing protein [Gammaproteobacteria bacterium]|nr:DUF3429 domain-containing protein [Gammaproteobacteria bacterium]
MNEFSPQSGTDRAHSGRTKLLLTLTTYVGVLPYVGLAAWMWSHQGGEANHVLAIYAALMFVYTGAVQWGWAIADQPSMRVYAWSMLALVVGWVLASLPWYFISLILLAIATAGFWYAERRWISGYSPDWYRAVRAQTAILAALCLFAAWIDVLVDTV